MNQLVEEWLRKSSADLQTARREIVVTEATNYDIVCFLSQQSIEKGLKALLILHNQPVVHSHDLVYLTSKLLQIYPFLTELRSDLRLLGSYAVEYRYPGSSATKANADSALSIAEAFREMIYKDCGLEHMGYQRS